MKHFIKKIFYFFQILSIPVCAIRQTAELIYMEKIIVVAQTEQELEELMDLPLGALI